MQLLWFGIRCKNLRKPNQNKKKSKKACLTFPVTHENDLSIHPFGVNNPKQSGLKNVVGQG